MTIMTYAMQNPMILGCLSLSILAAACIAPASTVERDDAGATSFPTVTVDVEEPDAAPAPVTPPPPATVVVIVERPDAAAAAPAPAVDAGPTPCPELASCGTILDPLALLCLASIAACDEAANHAAGNFYDACMDACLRTELSCEASFVNTDGTVIGPDGEPANNYAACVEMYVVCGGACR
jgi:hypothetical protein